VSKAEGWRLLEAHTVFENAHLEVRQEKVAIENTATVKAWTVVRRKKAVVICPMTEDGRFILIHEARIPVRKWLWAFPAGQIDDSHDPDMNCLRETALRELTEESGYTLAAGGELTALGHYYASPGFTDEQQYLFLARPVQPDIDRLRDETGETIAEIREFTGQELRSMIAENIIQDANTLVLFARLCARGLIG
jgi:8-oxo-dGTP pyrophosphatase MutT (NUDIX family)